MGPEALFRANLAVIDRVVREVCRSARVREDDVEDFASSVKLALIDDGYAVLKRWEGRSSLAGYLNVVIRRLLSDHRNHEFGRWRPSSEAVRMGETAVLIERLIVRDRRAFDEIVPFVRAHDPSLTDEEIASIAGRLPLRTARPRAVGIDDADESSLASSERADGRLLSREVRRISARASDVVRKTLAGWPDEDLMILRFHFGSAMTIAEISRMLRLPQRPLYRRIEGLLSQLRAALAASGLDAAGLSAVIGEASQEMDFGLSDGKDPAERQSYLEDAAPAAEEMR
jgi:RNA polymerase sigma factor for flagellar operon FliA